MRATAWLVAASVTAMAIAVGSTAPASPPDSVLAAGRDGVSQVPPDDAADGRDGLLYADPETGCIRPWREGDGEPVISEDVRRPRPMPLDPSRVQDPEPMSELFPPTHRRPWPTCDDPLARVQDGTR